MREIRCVKGPCSVIWIEWSACYVEKDNFLPMRYPPSQVLIGTIELPREPYPS